MRHYIFLLPLAFFCACTSGENARVESAATTEPSAKATVSYPYEITYSSQFEIGDAEKSKLILDLWKDFDRGDLSGCGNKFADTVSMYMADGEVIHASRDSMLAITQRYRNSLPKVESKVVAVLPARSIDKNQNWVSVWGTEYITYPDNRMDSAHLMETWRFDSTGKVDMMLQYKRMFPKTNK
jgi:hypothetical protein